MINFMVYLFNWIEEERKLILMGVCLVLDSGLGVVMYFILCDFLRLLFICSFYR